MGPQDRIEQFCDLSFAASKRIRGRCAGLLEIGDSDEPGEMHCSSDVLDIVQRTPHAGLLGCYVRLIHHLSVDWAGGTLSQKMTMLQLGSAELFDILAQSHIQITQLELTGAVPWHVGKAGRTI